MNKFIDTIVRTPGVLTMGVLGAGFTVNAGVQYLHATNLEGPNLLAAACLVVGQITMVVVHQVRKLAQQHKQTAIGV